MLPVRLQRVKNRRAKDFGLTFIFFLLENDPKTYSEAMSSIEALF